MRFSPICLAILAVGCASPGPRAMRDMPVITAAEAQQVLRATPATIPGYPVTFLRLWDTDRIIVRQTLDSGRIVEFIEEHDRPRSSYGVYESPEHAAFEQMHGRPTVAEKLFGDRQAQRRVGEVNVWYLGRWADTQSELAELLDRLAPIS